MTFEGEHIVLVETGSNDPPIYYEARKWVEGNMPEFMAGPCKGRGHFAEESTPGECARAMTEGSRRFYAETVAKD